MAAPYILMYDDYRNPGGVCLKFGRSVISRTMWCSFTNRPCQTRRLEVGQYLMKLWNTGLHLPL